LLIAGNSANSFPRRDLLVGLVPSSCFILVMSVVMLQMGPKLLKQFETNYECVNSKHP
jgi:hypothetical protein